MTMTKPATASSWFEVDRQGLAKLREGTPKSALVLELVQNAWDTDATTCDISLTKEGLLTVTDNDPRGFNRLSDAYTLFAESEKKPKLDKRGRFNLGEKLVLALCEWANLETMTGTVMFQADGTRVQGDSGIANGSRFTGQLSLTKNEYFEVVDTLFKLLPPENCTTTFNGTMIATRTPLRTTTAFLHTVVAKEDGVLRAAKHKATVEIYEPCESETPTIYEMGIPVVETEDRYHYNVLQKVPLTMDRTNVTPVFLKEVREAAAETMVSAIDGVEANKTWVREAAKNPEASKELVAKVFEARFGKDAVIYDFSDAEANLRAVEDGKTLVKGPQMSKEEWANVRQHEVAVPAGRVYKDHKVETDPGGREFKLVKEVTPGMQRVAALARNLAKKILRIDIMVSFISEPCQKFGACYGGRYLRYNVGRLGYRAFENGVTVGLLDLTIHELAHELALNHLSTEFYEACTMIGAKAVALALTEPTLFEDLYKEKVTA
jgi:hypothetical protein